MANTLLSACRGPEAEVTDLQWASAFLTEIDGDNGVLGEAMKKSDDPTALYHAWNATCRLIRNLHAAHAEVAGEKGEAANA